MRLLSLLCLMGLLSACSGSSPPTEPGSPPAGPPAARGKAPGHLPGQGPPAMGGPGGPGGPPGGGSGAQMQDPSGFPMFHDWPAPAGPPIQASGGWSAPVKLTETSGGGYRPQIAVTADGNLHAIYYERAQAGDLIRHRSSPDGRSWSAPAPLGLERDRNWGPDIVARPDGSLVVVFDHAKPDFSSRGYITIWRGGSWSSPEPLTEDDGGEIGSGHIADGTGEELAYVWIGKPLDPQAHFKARWRWYKDGQWSAPADFSDGSADAWHTNVERRPDGSMLAGFDIGTGGSETTLYVSEGRDGRFGPLEDLSATGKPGERPHFAFGSDGRDHVTWFHKEAGKPVHVYVRSGKPGAWGPVQEPSAGYGGFHFDPEIAINSQGTLALVWGWDAGAHAELVYSLNKGGGWSQPARVATLQWGKPGLASLVAGPDGDFHVVWNQGVRGKNEVYYSRLEAE